MKVARVIFLVVQRGGEKTSTWKHEYAIKNIFYPIISFTEKSNLGHYTGLTVGGVLKFSGFLHFLYVDSTARKQLPMS